MNIPEAANIAERLKRQLAFIVEIDQVKNILRKTKLFSGSRFENDAEHSWTVCVMAAILQEHANFAVDIGKVIRMLLIHDIVEVDAGDVFLYSPQRQQTRGAEEKAAERIFGLLEGDQKQEYIDLWREFEDRQSNEAKFAAVFDRLEPVLQNWLNEGSSWKEHGIRRSQVLEKNRIIAEGSAELWELAQYLINDSVARGYLAE